MTLQLHMKPTRKIPTAFKKKQFDLGRQILHNNRRVISLSQIRKTITARGTLET